VSSGAGEPGPAERPGARSSRWLWLIGGLACGVIGLNTALFFLVQSSQQGIASREVEVQRRLADLIAKEAQVPRLNEEIAILEGRRVDASRQAEEDNRRAGDLRRETTRLAAERDRVQKELQSLQAEVAKSAVEVESSRARVEALKSQETAAQKAKTDVDERVVVLEKDRDARQAEVKTIEKKM
jgi:chromosome segregation ATPase